MNVSRFPIIAFALLGACVAGGCAGERLPSEPQPGQRIDAAASNAAAAAGGDTRQAADGDSTGILIKDRSLYVNGENYFIKGICWNPVPRGGRHPDDLDFAGFGEPDIAAMAAVGFNTIRTYEPIRDRAVLDKLHDAGFMVINTVYSWGGAPVDSVDDIIAAVGDHPAILMWSVGNEWNYNGLYADLDFNASVARVNAVARRVKQLDPTRPVTTAYGELPDSRLVARMPDIDIWGLNVYSGISFADRFRRWKRVSDKPMYLAEYGADAYNARIGKVDLKSQAKGVVALTREIIDNSTVYGGSVALGGTLFSWADEWWKVQGGSPSVQDLGGVAPGGGPYPDDTFNEEFWGLVDIDRVSRPVVGELRALFESLEAGAD